MDLAPGVHIERYVVEARLSSSALATVYRLRHLDDGARYVLKVLHLDRPTLQDRILAQGRAQSRLRHPNVASLVDVLDIGGSPGLLTEYVQGPSLERVLASVRLDLEVVERLVPGILAGVAAAHAQSVVHRDLEPANIFLDIRKTAVVPKIAEFGLAQLLGAHRAGITGSGATLTTPNYMAPETIRNARSADARSDLFALGAVLYELVTGAQAFESDNVFATLSEITSGRYVPVQELRPEVPVRIVRAIEAALELEVEDRVADCEELWQIWAGPGAPDLAVAAARPVQIRRALARQLAALAPPVEPARSSRGGLRRIVPESPGAAFAWGAMALLLVALAGAALALAIAVTAW